MNNNKFLTLLMGEKWYEWSEIQYHGCDFNPNHPSNPLPVIRWMEKEMPEVWEKYLKEIFAYKGNTGFELPAKLNKALDLSNLITYLSKNREWGYFEYPDYQTGEAMQGKHPALIYLESEEATDAKR